MLAVRENNTLQSALARSQKDRVERDTVGNKIALDGIWVTLKGTRLAELPARNGQRVPRALVQFHRTPRSIPASSRLFHQSLLSILQLSPSSSANFHPRYARPIPHGPIVPFDYGIVPFRERIIVRRNDE